MNESLVWASPEVISHHAREHAKICGNAQLYERLCPCGATVGIACGRCGRPIFLLMNPLASELCEHGREIMDIAYGKTKARVS